MRPVLCLVSLLLVAGCGDSASPSYPEPDAATTPDAPGSPDAAVADAMVVPLSAQAGADVGVCPGAGAVLGAPAAAGRSYQWSPADGLSATAVAQPTASPATTTTYTLLVTDLASGETATDEVVVTAHGAAVADAGDDATTDPGAGVAVGTTPAAGQTYQWTCGRADCALSDPEAAQPVVTPVQSTEYTVTATTPAGCSATSTAIVWVHLQATVIPDGVTTGSPDNAWPYTATLTVEFDQPILASSLDTTTVQLFDAAIGTPVPVTLDYVAAERRLHITPGAGYSADTDYTIVLAGGMEGIVSDDPLPNFFAADVVVDYVTTPLPDTTPPGLASSVPASGTIGVPVNQVVSLTFDEPVDVGTVTAANVRLVRDSDGAIVFTTLAYDEATLTATLTPASPLAVSTVYRVEVVAVADLSGNAMALTTITFTTGSQSDVVPPTVIAFSPTGNSVLVTALVTVTFNEAVDSTTLAAGITVRETDTGAPVAGVITYNPTTFVATFDPTALLAGQTAYTITVVGVTDLAGNAIAAPGQSSSFTTTLVLFLEDFESGVTRWTLDAPMGLAVNTFSSPRHSLADSPSGNYARAASLAATLATPVSVTGTTTVTVQWRQRTRTSNKKDWVYMEYRFDDEPFVDLIPRTSGNSAWTLRTAVLNSAGKQTLTLRWRLVDNDDNRQTDGFYVDDVVVQSP